MFAWLALKLAVAVPGSAAVFLVATGDVAKGALIAGVFSVVNTFLNARLLRRIAEISSKVDATKRTAHVGVRELHELADELKNGPTG